MIPFTVTLNAALLILAHRPLQLHSLTLIHSLFAYSHVILLSPLLGYFLCID